MQHHNWHSVYHMTVIMTRTPLKENTNQTQPKIIMLVAHQLIQLE